MKRFLAVLTIVPLLTVGLTACAEEEPEYAAMCVDPDTEERLPDEYCDDDSSSFLPYAVFWYMAMNSGHAYPGVGSKVNRSYVTTTLPKGAKYTTGLSKTGGTSVKSWTTKSGGSSGWGSGSKGSTGRTGGGTSGRTSTGRR